MAQSDGAEPIDPSYTNTWYAAGEHLKSVEAGTDMPTERSDTKSRKAEA